MSDLISRQAVLNTLDNMDKALDEDRTVEKYKELLTECIKVLPSAENKGEWIPVTERLPLLRGLHKISDDVLITNGFEIDMGYLVERKGKIFWHYYGSEYEFGIKDEDNDARAWMPLPEPYKTESEKV